MRFFSILALAGLATSLPHTQRGEDTAVVTAGTLKEGEMCAASASCEANLACVIPPESAKLCARLHTQICHGKCVRAN